MQKPKDIQLIGDEIAVIWENGQEGYISSERLRAASPSAETQGERDIFGQKYGGHSGKEDYSSVKALGWNPVGGYAVQFIFSDGHSSGIYTYDYLHALTTSEQDKES